MTHTVAQNGAMSPQIRQPSFMHFPILGAKWHISFDFPERKGNNCLVRPLAQCFLLSTRVTGGRWATGTLERIRVPLWVWRSQGLDPSGSPNMKPMGKIVFENVIVHGVCNQTLKHIRKGVTTSGPGKWLLHCSWQLFCYCCLLV